MCHFAKQTVGESSIEDVVVQISVSRFSGFVLFQSFKERDEITATRDSPGSRFHLGSIRKDC